MGYDFFLYQRDKKAVYETDIHKHFIVNLWDSYDFILNTNCLPNHS
jgi:hypothetical protein